MRDSNRRTTMIVATLMLSFTLSVIRVSAQGMSGGQYKITSSAQAGGGGNSTGSGNKVIEGTVGQSAASGPLNGGSIAHHSGFWPATLIQPVPGQGGPPTLQFSASTYAVQEDLTALAITVTRSGDASAAASVNYASSDGTATQRGDYELAFGTLYFAPGETSKIFQMLINEDDYLEGSETFTLTLSNASGAGLNVPSVATVIITDDSPEALSNPIDQPGAFIHLHYHDFLNREPDAPGLAHWTSEITMCSDIANRLPGESESQCVDRKRTNTSGAFYLSNEFQNSANFLLRVNWGTLGQDRAIGRKCIAGQYSALDAVCRPLYSDYISDLAKLTQGIVVNDALDPSVINANKHNFVNEFVARPDFLAVYPNTMTAAEYVDKLTQVTGIALTNQERVDLIAKVGTNGRAAVLYDMVDGTTTIDGGFLRFDTRYGKTFYDQEFNPAFVFAEYVGYLRRNPDQAGFDHWLGKLNLYGNFVDAEMVRAFIVSDEYRSRFGPN